MIASGMPVGSGRGLFEAPTYTCSHCQRIVVRNPNRRKDNPREWCKSCDHYICDPCGQEMLVTKQCVPFQKKIDEVLEAAAKQQTVAPQEEKTPILLLS